VANAVRLNQRRSEKWRDKNVGRDYVGDGRHCEATGVEREPAAVSKTVLSYGGPRVRIHPLSSKQSVSRGISPSCIEKRAVAAGCAGPARRHGRRRRAGLVNITPLPVISLSGPIWPRRAVPPCRGCPNGGIMTSQPPGIRECRIKSSGQRADEHCAIIEGILIRRRKSARIHNPSWRCEKPSKMS
jgi:hypothetical protein